VTAARFAFPPELQFILACARRAYTGGPLEIRSGLLDRIDWDALTNAGVYHKLGAILYRGLSPGERDLMPAHLRLLLAHKERKDREQASALTAELQRLAAKLRDQSIRFLTYKGAVASRLVYTEPHLRKYGDIDLLVPERSLDAAKQLLNSDGYECTDSPDRQRWLKECSFEHPERPGPVDLHWSLVPGYLHLKDRFTYPFERPWEISVGGTCLPTLTAELMLLDFCLQGAKERWHNLARVVDVAGFIASQHSRIDWDHLNTLSVDTGCDRVLQTGLAIAQELFSVTAPPHFNCSLASSQCIQDLVDDAVESYCDIDHAASQALSQSPDRVDNEPVRWPGFISNEPQTWVAYLPRIASKRADRLRIGYVVAVYYAKRLFTIYEHDRRIISLPGFLYPLSVVIKCFRLALKYTRGAEASQRLVASVAGAPIVAGIKRLARSVRSSGSG
jgi:hypothetical protein